MSNPPSFLNRAAAVAWLQRRAVAQARLKYGPAVRTSIGRTSDIRILCNYLGVDQRQLLPTAVRQREARQHAATQAIEE
jgi:hypothetical protein